MKILRVRQAGDPVLRQKARQLSLAEIQSEKIKLLIEDLKYTVKNRNYGVGVSAPQVGESIMLSVIAIKPTSNRPNLKKADFVLINPKITKTYGNKTGMWEGCFSVAYAKLFAKAMRYKKIDIEYLDEPGKNHKKSFDGFEAQVLQHEIGHLNGVLFTDLVVDPKTIINASEYRKLVKKGLA